MLGMTDIACWKCGKRSSIDGPPFKCSSCTARLRRAGGAWKHTLRTEILSREREGISELGAIDVPALSRFLTVTKKELAEYINVESSPPPTTDVPGLQSAPPATGQPDTPVPIPSAVCERCGASFNENVAFCSMCGSPTQPPGIEDRIHSLEKQVKHLTAALASRTTSADHTFLWHRVASTEKWAVAWGVWARTILINIIVFFALAILLGGIGVLAFR